MANSQYAGRTIDVLALNTADGRMFDSTSTGRIVTGMYKLAQRALIVFMTERDTFAYDMRGFNTTIGTTFMSDLRQGYIRTESDVFASFAAAELQARSQLQAEEDGTEPDDERYSRMALRRVVISNAAATLYVSLYSRANSVELIIPISTLP